MAKEAKPLAPKAAKEIVLTTAAAGQLLDLTPRWLQKLAEADPQMRLERGAWPLFELVGGYLSTLKAEKQTGTKSEAADRKRVAEAERIERLNAKEAGELIETDEALSALEDVVGLLRSDIASIPARVTRDLELRNKIKVEIDNVFSRASERLAKASSDLRQGRESAGTESENSA